MLTRTYLYVWTTLLLSVVNASFLHTRQNTHDRLSRSKLFSRSADNTSNGLSRRQVGELAVAATGLGITAIGTAEVDPIDYGLWGIVPVGPYKRKKTIRETIVPDQIWTCDQKFGILNVQVPLRMTILRLSDNTLLVYDPIAATRECLGLVQEIVDQYQAPVRHILVGSVAIEHKAFAAVFAQKFPDAQVYLQPGQYSFPTNLPPEFLGFPVGRTHTMPASIDQAPAAWRNDLDVAILGPIISRDGAFGETVVLHRPTQTLLVTDTCVQVTDEVPAIYEYDHAPLLFHARDTVTDRVEDTPATRAKAWKRVVLFGLFFMPSAIRVKDVLTVLKERRPDINADFAGVYPWDWVGDEEASWRGLTGENKPLVAPILQTLLLNRNPVEVMDFANKVGQWPIRRIIPAHLKNNLAFTGEDYRNSFGFLTEQGVPPGYPKPLEADLQTLLNAEKNLVKGREIAPAPPKLGGSASRADIIAQSMYRCRNHVCTPKSVP